MQWRMAMHSFNWQPVSWAVGSSCRDNSQIPAALLFATFTPSLRIMAIRISLTKSIKASAMFIVIHTLLWCDDDYALRFYMAVLFLPDFPDSSPLLLSPSKPPLCVSVLRLSQALKQRERDKCVYNAISNNRSLYSHGQEINKLTEVTIKDVKEWGKDISYSKPH